MDNLVAAFNTLDVVRDVNLGQSTTGAGPTSSSNGARAAAINNASTSTTTSTTTTTNNSNQSIKKNVQKNSGIVSVGLTGSEFSKLLQMLCYDFPPEMLRLILLELEKKETELVSFTEFAAAINACLLYEEFIKISKRIFQSIDRKGAGKIDKKQFLTELKFYCDQHRECSTIKLATLIDYFMIIRNQSINQSINQ